LRNVEVIGLTWDCVRLEEEDLLISKSLRRDGIFTHKRFYSGIEIGKAFEISFLQQVVEVLRQHMKTMQYLGLNMNHGLLFVITGTRFICMSLG